MEYTKSINGNNYEAILSGKLQFNDMQLFREIIHDFEASNKISWIVDLTNLKSIEPAGLGLLLCIKDAANKKKNKLSLRIPNDGIVKEMMKISKFHQLIPLAS